jgi:hypothetical protein
MEAKDQQARSADALGSVAGNEGNFGGWTFPKEVPKNKTKGGAINCKVGQNMPQTRDVTGEYGYERSSQWYGNKDRPEHVGKGGGMMTILKLFG